MFYQKVVQHQDKNISNRKQKKLNKPLKGDPSEDHHQYFEFLYNLLEEKKIDLTGIQSIIHQDRYNELSHEQEGKVDMEATNLLHFLRRLHDLLSRDHHKTHQACQLVEHIWQVKERVEEKYGNVFII